MVHSLICHPTHESHNITKENTGKLGGITGFLRSTGIQFVLIEACREFGDG